MRTSELVIEPYSANTLSETALAHQQLGIVAASRAAEVVRPGLQTGLSVLGGHFIAERIGKVLVDNQWRTAAGRLIQQFAYAAGVEPGHAGVYADSDTGRVDIVASNHVKTRLRGLSQSDNVGYFHIVNTQGLPPCHEGFSSAISTRQQLETTKVIGVTVANVTALLCPDTLESLVDPLMHPVLGPWFEEVGLRQNEQPGL